MNILLLLVVIIVILLGVRQNSGTRKFVAWYIIAGGLIFGIAGLILGVLGAIIFAPGNNLAPIIGVLFTGPVGFLIGLFVGYFYWKTKVISNRKDL